MTGVAGAQTTASTLPQEGEDAAEPVGAAVIRAVPALELEEHGEAETGPLARPGTTRSAAPEASAAPAAGAPLPRAGVAGDVPAEALPGGSAAASAGATTAPVTEGDSSGPRRGRRALRGTGIRERRRQQTRNRIVDAATELFAERGFDAVSVVEIAQRAGVVEKTVFNHFPVKEGLVFDADPPMRAALLDAVRRRPAGESVAAAAGSFVVAAVSMLGTPEAADGVAQMARVIRSSRTLLTREREILGELTDALAALIAEETGARPGQVEPWLAAHAVLGLYASLLELARDRVLAGVSGPELAAELRRQGRRGLALLQFGLAGYAKRR
ncbi:TetR/AcrR family transcriptional regulator [Blastococcus saxobsidens]|uniref:TetR/AcrR family transcriptional regulator n=1 Tax=Blastococcus saxobsidens TaxID=138336 RepID=UPI00102D19D3|nr:TetR/AcrR family transcriptional regulator [Blastococcus saxobsidens]